jgi:digeranylgeranylglycerophospholipid reductase
MYDVVISGAGPAGSKCAEVVAKAGFKVALIEKDVNWRKPCGGGIPSSKIYKQYPDIREKAFHKIQGLAMYSDDYHKIDYLSDNVTTSSLTVDRLVFDNYVRDIAVKAGAELFDKNFAQDFIYSDNKIAGVKTKSPSGEKTYQGKIVIIADGMSSRLAVRSGLRGKWKPENLGISRVEILEGPHNLDEKYVYFFFKRYGYCWIFCLGDNRFNIGSIIYGESNLQYNANRTFEQFMQDEPLKELLPEKEYRVIWAGNFPEPARGVLEKSLYGDNLMIIGDAAGFVAPINGEGIQPGITSGQVAGEIAVKALKQNDCSSSVLKAYKYHPLIKKMIRKYKFQGKFVEFFYENNGENLNKIFKRAEDDEEFRRIAIDIFIYGKTPPKDFISLVKSL